MENKKEYGLVLAGGGTKGAFQVGVWKALKELNINIKVIVGASIGALNGAFFLQDDIENVEKLYENISIKDIMNVKSDFKEDKNIFYVGNIANLAKDYTKEKGLDNTPLRNLILKNIDMDKLYNSEIDFGLITYEVKTKSPLKVFKNDVNKDKMVDYLLASSCFPIFKPQIINNEEYFDGGLYDNIPINLLIEKGYKDIIVADIAGVGFSKKLENKDIYVKVISPSEDLGGTFEFNHDKIKRNMRLGYLDTMKSFNKLEGHIFYFETVEFVKMMKIFNLKDIYGLENAAQIYGMDRCKIYTFETFINELKEKHEKAQDEYNLIKSNLNNKKIVGFKRVVNNFFDKGLGLCLVKDLYMDRPASNKLRYLQHYINDYIVAVKAIIEMENYKDNM